MNALPIIERELRVRARQGATYWTRFAVVLLGLLACLPLLWGGGPFGSAAVVGKYVFEGLSIAAFLLSCSACLLTADAISAERREGTLGLLLLTRVRSLDVLVGKLGSVGLTGFCALVAFLPVLLLPVLAGGVTGGEAVRKGLVLLNTLFVALAAGLFASASRQERSQVLGISGGLMVLILFGPMLLHLSSWPPGAFSPGGLNPISCFIAAADAAYKSAPWPYWISLGAIQVTAWLLLAGAVWRFRRSLRQEGQVAVVASPGSLRQGEANVRPHRWHVGGESNPVACLVRRQRGIQAMFWTAALLGVLPQVMWAVVPRFLGRIGSAPSWVLMFQLPGLALALLEAVLFAWAASRFFVEARRSGELELLLTTPAGAQTIVSGQWTALKRLLRGPVLVMLLPVVFRLMLIPLSYSRGAPGYFWPSLFVGTLVSLVSVPVLVVAMCWLGMWFGFKASGQARAILWTVGLGKGVPFLLSYLGAPLFVFLVRAMPPRPFGGSAVYMSASWVPQILALLVLFWFIRLARHRLLRELSGGEVANFSLGRSMAGAAEVVRKARQWTPS